MRIIKFRGKCVPDSKYAGEWVEGGYTPLDEESTSKNKGEGLIVVFLGGNCSCSYHVITETVGQFTGLLDKDGKEIYEGDILALQETDNKVTHCPVSMNCKGYWSIDFGINYGVCLGLVDKKRVEVIGNIHDNPELLKGGKDEDS